MRWICGNTPAFQAEQFLILFVKVWSLKSNESAFRPVNTAIMRTIKGLTVLLLVAAAVFAVAGMNNIKGQSRYAARLHSPALAEMADKPTVNVTGSVKSDKTATHTTGKIAKMGTKTDNQARRKIPAT